MSAVKSKTYTVLMEKKLKDHYYNVSNPASFGGVDRLAKTTKLKKADVSKWLEKQWTYTLHRPIRRKFPRRRYITRGMNYQWQVDLVEMQQFSKENKGYRYLLTAIDVFSRYAFARPLKDKTGMEVSVALESVFEENNYKTPQFLQADQGKEFYNSNVMELLTRYNIELFSVYSDKKAAIIERFNRTLKDRMYRYFTYQGNHEWLHILPQLLHSYNNSYHRVLKGLPSQVNRRNETQVWLKQYATVTKPKNTKTNFNIGDRVRISKRSGPFRRGYLPGWSDEEFIVTDINKKYYPIMYIISDLDGNIVTGSFYRQELQKIDNSNENYRIERVIRTRGVGSNKQAYVKWLGYSVPTWINYNALQHVYNVL